METTAKIPEVSVVGPKLYQWYLAKIKKHDRLNEHLLKTFCVVEQMDRVIWSLHGTAMKHLSPMLRQIGDRDITGLTAPQIKHLIDKLGGDPSHQLAQRLGQTNSHSAGEKSQENIDSHREFFERHGPFLTYLNIIRPIVQLESILYEARTVFCQNTDTWMHLQWPLVPDDGFVPKSSLIPPAILSAQPSNNSRLPLTLFYKNNGDQEEWCPPGTVPVKGSTLAGSEPSKRDVIAHYDSLTGTAIKAKFICNQVMKRIAKAGQVIQALGLDIRWTEEEYETQAVQEDGTIPLQSKVNEAIQKAWSQAIVSKDVEDRLKRCKSLLFLHAWHDIAQVRQLEILVDALGEEWSQLHVDVLRKCKNARVQGVAAVSRVE